MTTDKSDHESAVTDVSIIFDKLTESLELYASELGTDIWRQRDVARFLAETK